MDSLESDDNKASVNRRGGRSPKRGVLIIIAALLVPVSVVACYLIYVEVKSNADKGRVEALLDEGVTLRKEIYQREKAANANRAIEEVERSDYVNARIQMLKTDPKGKRLVAIAKEIEAIRQRHGDGWFSEPMREKWRMMQYTDFSLIGL